VSGPVPEGRDPDDYDRLRRRVLWSMPTGLFLVGSRSGDEANLMAANLVVQVATTPKLVAAAVEADSVTRRLIEAGGWFSVSLLARADRAVVRRFVKPVEEVVVAGGVLTSLQGEAVHQVAGGVPVLAGAAAWLACALRSVVDPGTDASVPSSHVLCIGEVVDAGEATGAGGPRVEVLRMEDTRMNYGG
jgi:flavin reductase (DIM6/NTAB) family NADH-FMN oxidoreductase RutF